MPGNPERDPNAALLLWDIDSPIPDDLYDRMVADPRIGQAVRTLAANLRAVADDDKALDGIFKDAGRYLAAMWAVYLHLSGGLTLPRLKEICISSGFLSPGRARALLLYMRYLGYIVTDPRPRQGGPVRYVPTEKFMASWTRHLRAAVEAAQVIEPGVQAVLNRLDEPDVAAALARLHGEGLTVPASGVAQHQAYMTVFIHRHAGTQLIWTLLLETDDAVFPPRHARSISVAALARRFSVSRIHIKRLLAAAQAENLLDYAQDAPVQVLEKGRDSIRFFYTSQIIRLLITAAKTLTYMENTPKK